MKLYQIYKSESGYMFNYEKDATNIVQLQVYLLFDWSMFEDITVSVCYIFLTAQLA